MQSAPRNRSRNPLAVRGCRVSLRHPGALVRTIAVLDGARFLASSELELQASIASRLESAGIPFEREARLGRAGTIDFLITGEIGLEVKVDGSLTAVTEQLYRYAASGLVGYLIIATTRSAHRRIADRIDGVSVDVVLLRAPL